LSIYTNQYGDHIISICIVSLVIEREIGLHLFLIDFDG
jgi:hypothetical protein